MSERVSVTSRSTPTPAPSAMPLPRSVGPLEKEAVLGAGIPASRGAKDPRTLVGADLGPTSGLEADQQVGPYGPAAPEHPQRGALATADGQVVHLSTSPP